jgi:hypothetical protein
MNRPATYDAFVTDFHEYMTHNPNVCAELGVDERQGDLPDPSLASAQSRVSEAHALLGRARAFDRAGLDFDAALDLDLAELLLEATIHN